MIHYICLSVAGMSGFMALANALRYGRSGETLGWVCLHGLCFGLNLSFGLSP